MNTSEPTLDDLDLSGRVLDSVARRILRAMGIRGSAIPSSELRRFAQVDIFAGGTELAGHELDSLALAEVLVDLEDELGVSVLDQADVAGDAPRVADLIDSILAGLPREQIEAWIADDA